MSFRSINVKNLIILVLAVFIQINFDEFKKMNAKYQVVNTLITDVADEETINAIKTKLISHIYTPLRTVKALLFIDKIYCSVIVEDEVFMFLRKNTNNDFDGILVATVSQIINIREEIIKKLNDIMSSIFPTSTPNRRIYVFYWSIFDKLYLKTRGLVNEKQNYGHDSTTNDEIGEQRRKHWMFIC